MATLFRQLPPDTPQRCIFLTGELQQLDDRLTLAQHVYRDKMLTLAEKGLQ